MARVDAREGNFTLTIVHGGLEEPIRWESYEPLMDNLIDLGNRHFPGRVTTSGQVLEVIDGDPAEEVG